MPLLETFLLQLVHREKKVERASLIDFICKKILEINF